MFLQKIYFHVLCHTTNHNATPHPLTTHHPLTTPHPLTNPHPLTIPTTPNNNENETIVQGVPMLLMHHQYIYTKETFSTSPFITLHRDACITHQHIV